MWWKITSLLQVPGQIHIVFWLSPVSLTRNPAPPPLMASGGYAFPAAPTMDEWRRPPDDGAVQCTHIDAAMAKASCAKLGYFQEKTSKFDWLVGAVMRLHEHGALVSSFPLLNSVGKWTVYSWWAAYGFTMVRMSKASSVLWRAGRYIGMITVFSNTLWFVQISECCISIYLHVNFAGDMLEKNNSTPIVSRIGHIGHFNTHRSFKMHVWELKEAVLKKKVLKIVFWKINTHRSFITQVESCKTSAKTIKINDTIWHFRDRSLLGLQNSPDRYYKTCQIHLSIHKVFFSWNSGSRVALEVALCRDKVLIVTS